ncbi:hypothetical protein V6Z12_D13G032200 [Gossypium hirsutum]
MKKSHKRTKSNQTENAEGPKVEITHPHKNMRTLGCGSGRRAALKFKTPPPPPWPVAGVARNGLLSPPFTASLKAKPSHPRDREKKGRDSPPRSTLVMAKVGSGRPSKQIGKFNGHGGGSVAES